MTLQTLTQQVGLALTAQLGAKVYHYRRPENEKFPFCVWAEDSEVNSFHTQDGNEQCIHFTVDYYTQTEFDAAVDTIQTVLNTLSNSWRLASVNYETETEAIHFEWEMELAWQSFRQ